MSIKGFLKYPGLNTFYSPFKYYSAWRQYNAPGRNSIIDRMPWITFAAVDYLKKVSQSDMSIFEYGSGGSTLFWASRVKQVVSVEHDKEWFNKMQKELTQKQITNVEYMLKEPNEDLDFAQKDFHNPKNYLSSDKNYSGKNFEGYVKVIDKYPDSWFDIIVVDGRARPSCILHAINRLKKNGYLIIDNSEREYYLAPFKFDKKEWEILNFWGPVPYIRHFSNTTILKKKDALSQKKENESYLH